MYDGDKAVIKMVKYLKEDRELDKSVYGCTVIEYQKDLEQLHLRMTSGNLEDISLDAIYECKIKTLQGESVCTGIIQDRFENRAGMILKLQIQNGFYEVNIK